MASGLKLAEVSVGMSLPELKRPVTQEHINLYAEASQDFNPIHIDPEFARQAGLGGTIAHGMLILAYIAEFMTNSFGQSWLTSGKLSTRFKAPARPGDTVTVSGKITKIQKEDGPSLIFCDISCRNQQGKAVIVGEATVRVQA